MKLNQLYKYPPLRTYSSYHRDYEKTLVTSAYTPSMSSALIGIEIEVENIKFKPKPKYYWKTTKDGSLRNNGLEFVSVPLRPKQIPYALDYLQEIILQRNIPVFSPRTSVHIHLNVRDTTVSQLQSLILLYAIFENHFFAFATARQDSIYCIPLKETDCLHSLLTPGMFLATWEKYCALNLGTVAGANELPRYGTVEFRHLHGTMDKEIILKWVNSILCLRKASFKYSFDFLMKKLFQLNTTSEYMSLYQDIFGLEANLPLMAKQDFEENISSAKALLSMPRKVQFNVDSNLGKLLSERNPTFQG